MSEPIDSLKTQASFGREVVQSLSEGDFARPSPGCPGWTVKDVVAHLTTGAQLIDRTVRRTGGGKDWAQDRAAIFGEMSALPVDQLKRRYGEVDENVVALLEGTDPAHPCHHPAYGDIPASRFVAMRTSEVAIHSWDIAAANDPNARLGAPALNVVYGTLAANLPSWVSAENITRRYRFNVDGDQRTLTIYGGKAAWTDGGEADASLTMDTGDAVLLLSGRMSSQQLIDAGRIKVDGDAAAARELSSLFRAYAGR